MAVGALSTFPAGTFFTTNLGSFTAPQQNFLLSASTGTTGSKMVAYNITQAAIQELDQATVVTTLTLTVGIQPVFSLA